jgi:tetratricopeptide (TPR) repeat protein
MYSEELQKIGDSTVILHDVVRPTKNDEARAAYNIGSEYLSQSNFDEAEKYLLKALELDPEYIDAMDHLGLVYRNQKRYDEAERIYLQSIVMMPGNSVPYINLAMVYRYQGRLEDARQIYLKAMDIDKDDPEPYYGIGSLYQLINRYENSIDYINIAIQKYYLKSSELIYDACYIQGDNYYHLNNYEEALKYYMIALIGHSDNDYLINKIKEIGTE